MPLSKVAQHSCPSVQRPRTTDALSTLFSNGTIDQNMHDAGRAFQALFQQAQIDLLRALLLTSIPGGGSRELLVPGDARVRLTKLLDRLGGLDSPTGRCAWAVLSEGRSLRDCAMREGWSDRPSRAEAARYSDRSSRLLCSRRQKCRCAVRQYRMLLLYKI